MTLWSCATVPLTSTPVCWMPGQPAQRRALLPQADSRRARGRLGQSRRPRFSHERADRPDRWTDQAGPHRPPLGQLLEPFRCRIMAHDPYVAKEVALAMHVQLTSLARVLGQSDVVVCCTPITPRTYRMIGAPQLDPDTAAGIARPVDG